MARKRTELAELLRQRFFSGLHLGVLKPGSRLPSARELAAELRVDRRVVLDAYRELEREGLVELRQRSGIYFSDRAPGVPGSRLTPPAEWAVDVLTQGLALGIPGSEFAARFHGYLSTLRLRVVCIECNTDQLASLCGELTTDYGLEATGADVDELLADETPRADIRRADLLVTTQFHAGEVQEIAAKATRPWIAVALRTDIYAEIARLLPSTAVYFVVVDQRYAVKLRKIFAATHGAANFHAVVIERDDVGHIPDTAPTYITRAAREKLTDARLLERVMPEERVFAPASAREILTLIVRANMAAIVAKRS